MMACHNIGSDIFLRSKLGMHYIHYYSYIIFYLPIATTYRTI